jgi:hypothetical protein
MFRCKPMWHPFTFEFNGSLRPDSTEQARLYSISDEAPNAALVGAGTATLTKGWALTVFSLYTQAQRCSRGQNRSFGRSTLFDSSLSHAFQTPMLSGFVCRSQPSMRVTANDLASWKQNTTSSFQDRFVFGPNGEADKIVVHWRRD